MPRRRKKGRRSYPAGRWGVNRVLAFEDERGDCYLEYRRREIQSDGTVKLIRTAELVEGAEDWADVCARADQAAVVLLEQREQEDDEVTLARVMRGYIREVTADEEANGEGQRRYHARAVRIWTAFFNAQPEKERHATRDPKTLDRIDWDRFIRARRAGTIPGFERPAKDRTVERDLKAMVAILNWAVGTPLLAASPWSAEVRRAQGWTMPREKNPSRPGMPEWIRDGLVEHAPAGWQFGAMLVLERETRRRNSSIRRLSWADIDQERWHVTWRGELDKVGKERVTPLTEAAVEILKALPSRGIGDKPVFPSAMDPAKPTPRGTVGTWLQRAKERWLAATPEEHREKLRRALHRVGVHSEKRTGVRDPRFRALPLKVQEEWSGTSGEVLMGVYDDVPMEDMEEAARALGATRNGAIGEEERRAGR